MTVVRQEQIHMMEESIRAGRLSGRGAAQALGVTDGAGRPVCGRLVYEALVADHGDTGSYAADPAFPLDFMCYLRPEVRASQTSTKSGEAQTAGKWDCTAVLVLSNHGMRDRSAYLREPRDTRVPFILKLPGQRTGVAYDRPFNALVTQDLVEALLRGELLEATQATQWLDARATPVSDPTVARR